VANLGFLKNLPGIASASFWLVFLVLFAIKIISYDIKYHATKKQKDIDVDLVVVFVVQHL